MEATKESGRRAVSSSRSRAIPPSSTVAIADLASRMRRQGLSVVDFSAGRAAEATSEAVCEAAKGALDRGDTHQTEARGRPDYLQACAHKLARDNGLDLDPGRHLIATLGCKQGLVLSLLSALDPGDEIVIEDPCFVSYEPTIRLLGGVPVRAPLRREHGYRWRREDLDRVVGPRTRAILFCSPHNPLGVVHGAEDLEVIAAVAQESGLTVIVDEIYEAVTWGGRSHLPIASLPGMAQRTIGLMGLTKTYSMGGWRIGYAYGPEALISRMVTAQQHLMTCASSFCQAGATRALGDEVTRSMRELWQDWEGRCEWMSRSLDDLPGLRASKPEGAFYAWVDIRELGLGSEELARRLLEEQQVAVVPGAAFGEPSADFLRVTCVRSRDELELGVERIGKFLETLSNR